MRLFEEQSYVGENGRYSLLCTVFWQELMVKAFSTIREALGWRLIGICDVEILMAFIDGKK